MSKLPARAGWHWVKQGFAVFRKQPGALMAILFSCMFVSLLSSILPLVGVLLPALLAPLFSVALLQGCADIDSGKRALPNLLLAGFRSAQRNQLLKLGVVYAVVLQLALIVLHLLGADAISQINESPGKLDPGLLDSMRGAVFASTLIYMGGWMLTCLAAPLIFWQKMALGKALFFSVMTVLREFKAFATMMVSLYLICQLLGVIPLLLFGSPQLAFAAVFSIILMLVVVMHCSLYAGYRQLFGAPSDAPTTVDLDKP
ncbi:BPSS1780 family membrane protein [Duganella sp.]|uniref:BPSS1780 family membrane protein n=1 Tax=Duganella sp. TaxID=1904440 RepID=UPI0031E0A518